MKPHELIMALVQREGSTSAVANAMGGPNFQGTLHKFTRGQTLSPKRATAERIARYFKLPTDAIYSERLATELAAKLLPARLEEPAAPWADRQHSSGGLSIPTVAQQMSQPLEIMDPTLMLWESIVSSPLPPLFRVAMPDDSMAPEFRKGSVVLFSTTEGQPRADDAVLVQDADGNPFVRVYEERRPGHWQAVALNGRFQPLDSKLDGLKVLAISMGKWGRRG